MWCGMWVDRYVIAGNPWLHRGPWEAQRLSLVTLMLLLWSTMGGAQGEGCTGASRVG